MNLRKYRASKLDVNQTTKVLQKRWKMITKSQKMFPGNTIKENRKNLIITDRKLVDKNLTRSRMSEDRITETEGSVVILGRYL